MISKKNIELLNIMDGDLRKSLEEFDEGSFTETVIEKSKSGVPTLIIKKEDREYYLSSRYKPVEEAKTLIDEFEYDKDKPAIFFYGTGLGYHIKEFLDRNPDIHFFIYEPRLEIMYRFLENFELSKYNRDRFIGITNDKKKLEDILVSMYEKFRTNYIIYNLPAYTKIYTDEINEFLEIYKKVNMEQRSRRVAMLKYQDRDIISQVKNFDKILKSPNILDYKEGSFKDRVAILVAAGPSLEDEYENLRIIKEKNMAYIFAVGSAVNSLISKGIIPDALFGYDSGKEYYKVTERIIKEGIREIPFIFAGSVGYEALEGYPGETFFMNIFTDSLVHNFLEKAPLNYDFREENTAATGGTISVSALDTMVKMGFSKIYLVGQNFGYRGGLKYAKGIDYINYKEERKADDNRALYLKTVDVYGNPIETIVDYVTMKEGMEHLIKNNNIDNVINTTKGGVDIKGAPFKELSEEMKSMKENNAPRFRMFINPPRWNKEELRSRIAKFDKEKSQISDIISDYNNSLDKIEEKIDRHDFRGIQKDYTSLDSSLKKMENNKWSLNFPLPCMQDVYEDTADRIYMMNLEKNQRLKAKQIHSEFHKLLEIYEREVEASEALYNELKETIENYLNNND